MHLHLVVDRHGHLGDHLGDKSDDSVVFKTESETGCNVHEFIEEVEIHIVAHGSS